MNRYARPFTTLAAAAAVVAAVALPAARAARPAAGQTMVGTCPPFDFADDPHTVRKGETFTIARGNSGYDYWSYSSADIKQEGTILTPVSEGHQLQRFNGYLFRVQCWTFHAAGAGEAMIDLGFSSDRELSALTETFSRVHITVVAD